MPNPNTPKEAQYPYVNVMQVTVAVSQAVTLTIRSIAGSEPCTNGEIITEVLNRINTMCEQGHIGLEFQAIYHDPED